MTDHSKSISTNDSMMSSPTTPPLSSPQSMLGVSLGAHPPFTDPAFPEWCELKIRNEDLVSKTGHLLSKLEGLKRRLSEQERYMNSSKPKRHRRTAKEIPRNYPCSHCGKAYGSEGALLQHIGLKHQASGEKQGDST